MWCIINIPIQTSAKTTDVTRVIKYAHEFVILTGQLLPHAVAHEISNLLLEK